MLLIQKVALSVDTRKFASWVSRTFPRTPKNVQAPGTAGQGRIPPLPFAPKMVPSQNQNRAEMFCGPIRQGGAMNARKINRVTVIRYSWIQSCKQQLELL
jgi:hypothetical protein